MIAFRKFGEWIRDIFRSPSEIPSYPSTPNCSVESVNNLSLDKPVVQVPIKHTDEYYNMNHQYRGLVIVFNHEQFLNKKKFPRRNGTDIDARKIKTTFESLGFMVHCYKDMTLAEIRNQINQYLKQDHYHRLRDCLIVFVLTHGEDKYRLAAKDGLYDAPKELWNKFTAVKCPAFAAKPKLFFLQSCRGKSIDHGVYLKSLKDSEEESHTKFDACPLVTYPNLADILIYRSSSEGYVSYRNGSAGSRWITILCEEFKNNCKTMEINHILLKVNRRLANEFVSNSDHPLMKKNKQMPSWESSLTRQLIFGTSENKDSVLSFL